MGWNEADKKYINPTRNRLAAEMGSKIVLGQMTMKEANLAHHHELWTRVGQAMRADGLTFDYSRGEW